MERPLNLDANLTLTLENRVMRLQAERDQVVVKLPDWRAGMALMTQCRGRLRAARLRALPQQLQALELTVSVELAGRTLVRMGTQVQPSWLARRLNLGAVELHPISFARTWLQNRWRH